MAFKDLLKPHRSWEDGVGLILGLTIGLTPWLYDENPVPRVAVNAAVAGLAVLMLAQLEMLRRRRWGEFAQLVCGVWVIVSPFILDYAYQDHLRFWHWTLGGSVAALAVLELWQDWDLI